MQKAIGYIRVSTQGQADEGVSLAAQRGKIEAWCSLHDAELVAVFEDAGISGASMNGREGLHAALKAITKGMAAGDVPSRVQQANDLSLRSAVRRTAAPHADVIERLFSGPGLLLWRPCHVGGLTYFAIRFLRRPLSAASRTTPNAASQASEARRSLVMGRKSSV